MPLTPTMETLQYVEERGLPLYATCGKCGSTTALDVGVLARTLGRKTTFDELRPRLRCMLCRSREASLSVVKPVRRCPTCQRPL